MIAEKCAAEGNSIVQVPFEGFPEGPTLAGELACDFIDAIHAKGIGSIIRFKNERTDTASDELSADNDSIRSMMTVVMKSQPWIIYLSSSQGRGNIAERSFLAARLKAECGLQGCTLFNSDDPAEIERAFASGLDMNLPVKNRSNAGLIAGLFSDGRITQKKLDSAAFRCLRVILMASAKDMPIA